MEEISRRTFSSKALASVLTYSLLETLCASDVFADKIKPITDKWVGELNQLCGDVKGKTLRQIDWQKKVEELFKRVDLPTLLGLVDFENLTKKIEFEEKGPRRLRFNFDQVDGVPTKLIFGKQIFALKKGRSVVPHGHNNMATAFLILKGNTHGKHYDRLEDGKQHMIIKPTIDRKFGVGHYSTVSDHKDNVHWFKAVSDTAFIFNIHVLGLKEPGTGKLTGRVYVDPDGEKLAGGLIRAPRINSLEAHEKYG